MNTADGLAQLNGLEFRDVEQNLNSLKIEVLIAETGPPELFISIEGKAFPVAKRAATHLGALAGVRRSALKDYADDVELTAKMILHSLKKRGGVIHLGICRDRVIECWSAEKPHITAVETYKRAMLTLGNECYFVEHDDGSSDFLLLNAPGNIPTQDRLTDIMVPGVLLSHSGKPDIYPFVYLRSQGSGIRGPKKSPKPTKKFGIETRLDSAVNAQWQLAADYISLLCTAAAKDVDNAASFVSRLGWLHGYSKQSLAGMVQMIAGMDKPTKAYDLVALVSQDGNNAESVNRRSQDFAFKVLTHLDSVCSRCGLPSE